MKLVGFASLFGASLLASFAALPVCAAAQTRFSLEKVLPTGKMNEVIAGYVKVKLRPALAQTMANTGGKSMPFSLSGASFVKTLPGTSGWTLWSIPTIADPVMAARSLQGQSAVLSAEPLNKIYKLMPTPNDPDWAVQETDPNLILILNDGVTMDFRRLWHLTDTNAEAAWDVYPGQWLSALTKATNPPTIAFVDTGCDMDHPDFMNAGGSGTDITQGGQIDKSRSVQFQLGSVLAGGDPTDTNGHGTHVTGLALAAGNNGGYAGHGVIGTGFPCNGFICRVFDDSGNGTDADAAAAIYYAVDNGADIINLSLGTTNYSQLFQDATTYAWQKGVLVVAAGNENGAGGGDLGPIYPAACSGALAVTANGPNGLPANGTYSGYGPYVDIAAPGGDLLQSVDYIVLQWVYSTACRYDCALSQNSAMYPPYTLDYSYLIGTSMACPQVSGAAGLLWAYKNYHRSDGWANVKAYRALEKGAAGVMGAPYGGWESQQGYGCLDMWSALTDYDARGALVGGVEGIVYSSGTPVANVAVKAQNVGGGLTYSTTTRADGCYRFEGMPAGPYKVWAAPFGNLKTKKAVVETGSDLSGCDFWCGTYTGDTTPPEIARFGVVSASSSTLTFNTWALDPETGIDQLSIRVGTTLGASDVVAATEVVPNGNQVSIGSLSLTPNVTYYATLRAINGAGASTYAYAKVLPKALPYDASFVSQSAPSSCTHGASITVKVTMKNVGAWNWSPALRSRVSLSSANPVGNTTWGVSAVPLPANATVAPGGTVDFNFKIQAPVTPGTYNFQWQMKQGNTPFGSPSKNLAVVVK